MKRERTHSPVAVGVILALAMLGCEKAADDDPPPAQPAADAQMPPATDGGGGADDDGRFQPGSMPDALSNGGYIDSPFLNRAGDRFYFIHSIFAPAVLEARATPEACSDLQVPQLPGHVTADGLEWNTDIYYVEWDGERWSEPVNLGAPINSLGMECCMWLNADETEIIFNRVSDLDSDGEDGDVGLPPTGNYRATRADRNSREWR